jgi:hypothetical protein
VIRSTSECARDRIEQGGFAERLEQTLDRAGLEQPETQARLALSRDEDDRNRASTARQFLLQSGSAHAQKLLRRG